VIDLWILTGEFEEKCVPTLEAEVESLTFYTNRGEITFIVCDKPGKTYFRGVADAFIAMFDISSSTSLEKLPGILQEVKMERGDDIPIAVCGNKCDGEATAPIDLWIEITKRYFYSDLSVKYNLGLEEPFLTLMRKLLKDEALEILPSPAVFRMMMAKNEQLRKLLGDELLEIQKTLLVPDEMYYHEK
jgi:GTPase SAR1 family protein